MYYVYAWIDPRVNEFFYIGKGKERRAWNDHRGARCFNKLKRVLDCGYTMNDIVRILHNNLSEENALLIEEQLINEYKIIEDGGILFNYRIKGLASSSWKKICDSEIENIIFLYNVKEYTMLQISKIYNVHETTIRKYLKDKNILTREQGYSVFTGQSIQDVVDLYTTGVSASQIAQQYKCSVPTVLRLLRKNNIAIRRSTAYHTLQIQ